VSRSGHAVAAGVILAATTACAPGGTLPGVHTTALPGQPIEWFAQQWGPFDADLRGIGDDGRPRPLVILDGKQVARVDLGEATSDHLFPGVSLDRIRSTHVIKCREGAGFFGEAGNRGVVMIFTKAYRGPQLVEESLVRDDVPPCVPEPEVVPIEYFAQFGPFDPGVNIRRYFGHGPLIVLDGRQVEVDSSARIDDLLRLVVFDLGDRLLAVPGPAPSIGFVADFSRRDDLRLLRPVKCDLSHTGYGPAATGGLMLAFTDTWEGPLPTGDWTWGELCMRGER
jgi:hypothetical protein